MAVYSNDLELLRVTRADTLHLTGGLTQAQADYIPVPGKWSAGEVMDHLALADGVYRNTIADLIRLAKAGKRTVINGTFKEVNVSIAHIPKAALPFLEVPLTLFNLFVPPFVREILTEFPVLPTQNPDIAHPRKGLPIGVLREAIRTAYEKTAALFSDNPGLDYKRMRYRHPLLGDNNVLGLIRIVSFHERRHHTQLRTLFESRDFPRAKAA
jgi:DinB family protein